MTYEEKLKIANKFIGSLTYGSIDWDDLSDINSLHDAETEEDIKEMCQDRLADDGYPFDALDGE